MRPVIRKPAPPPASAFGSDEVRLIPEFGVSNAHWSAIAPHLCGAGRVEVSQAIDRYRRGRAQEVGGGGNGVSNRELTTMLGCIQQVRAGEMTREFLDLVIDDLAATPTDRLHEALLKTDRPSKAFDHRPFDLDELEGAILAAITSARGFLPNRSLLILIGDLVSIFERATTQRATHKSVDTVLYVQGSRTTAGRFIEAVVLPIDPDVTRTLISRAFAQALKTLNRPRGKVVTTRGPAILLD